MNDFYVLKLSEKSKVLNTANRMLPFVKIHISRYVFDYMSIFIYTYIYILIYMCIYTYTHTHTHIYVAFLENSQEADSSSCFREGK